jgi:hypothetical protein
MKYKILIGFLFFGISLSGQNTEDLLKGNVSYISSQHIYVQFVNTSGIHIGDTLYVLQQNKLLPVLIAKSLSSISCIGIPLTRDLLAISTQVFAKQNPVIEPMDVLTQKSKESIAINDLAIQSLKTKDADNEQKAGIEGRISVSSYSNVATDYPLSQRFRYNLSLDAKHIDNSKLSFDTYISFTHKTGDSILLRDDLKIYNLALKFDLNSTTNITLGRKINVNMANAGAVDGLQLEKSFNNFKVGALIGSRPDSVYGFNPGLLQYAVFVSHTIQNKNGSMQTSLAFFNQMTKFQTGRRFAYFQHSNSLLKNLDFFCSFEMDLYNAQDSTNTFDLTGTYLSLRYRPFNKLSLSLSYDARKNIYYYETYKSKRDSLFEKETRQGYRFQFSYRPFRRISWGGTAGYRIQTPYKASLNGYTYLNYSQIPFINVSATAFATINKSVNMNGMDYGVTFSRDIIDGKLSADLEYRRENYNLSNYTTTTLPNISLVSLIDNTLDLSLSWRIAKKLTLSADFEGSIDADKNKMLRGFINISQRF